MSECIEKLCRYLHNQAPILNSLNVALAIKDVDLNYRYFNSAALKQYGFSQPSDVYENSDFDMPWHDQAAIFQGGGKQVLAGSQLLTLDPVTDNNGNRFTTLCEQTPIIDTNNNIIGICCAVKTIASHPLVTNSRYVKTLNDEPYAEVVAPHMPNTPQHQYNLTLAEQQTLYYLLRGATAEHIANKLHRSPYTIKDRIDNLKSKFSCNSKTELIHSAIKKGYMQLIPAGLN